MFYYRCGRCKKVRAKYYFIPCEICLESREYKKEQKEFNRKFRMGKQLVGRFKEPTAFGFDKATGRPVAVDKHGKFFDPNETRYAGKGMDVHGWKATGKIKPKKIYHI